MIVTIDTKFKKKLIAVVKGYINILNGNIKSEASWTEMEKILILPSKSIEKLWYSFRKQYYNILLNKTIERDDSPSEWELFHDMSFMYNVTKENVKNNIGGLSPPLLQRQTSTIEYAREPCPCCIPVNSEPIEIVDIDSEILLERPTVIENEAAQSTDSMVLGEQIEHTASNETTNQINPTALVSNEEWTQDSIVQSSDSMGLDEDWIINSQVQPEDWITNYNIKPFETTVSNPQLNSQISPQNEALSSQPLSPSPVQASKSAFKMRPKIVRYGLNNTLQERMALRTKIIAAIQRYPVLYVKPLSGPKGTVQDAWNNVANDIGCALPKFVIQNRWRQAKQKFVEELLKERYCQNLPFVSKFENFQQMNFMRSHLKAEVEDIDKLRSDIRTIVEIEKNIKQLGSPTIDLCKDDPSPSNQPTQTQNLDSLTLDLTNDEAENVETFNSEIDNFNDPSPSNQPTQTQNLDCLTLDLTNVKAENGETLNSEIANMDSYQRSFEKSISSVKDQFSEYVSPTEVPKGDGQPIQPPIFTQNNPTPVEVHPVAVFELDYSSDEDGDQKSCEQMSKGSDSELEMYSEELVYISEPSTTICLDDDD